MPTTYSWKGKDITPVRVTPYSVKARWDKKWRFLPKKHVKFTIVQ